MSRSAAKILEDARQLPPGELDWLVQNLLGEGDGMSEEEFAAWQKEVGEPEPGYEEWFRAGVEEALAETSPGIPHEVVVEEIANLLRSAREAQKLKASA
jgi:Uma2 family endonuclease